MSGESERLGTCTSCSDYKPLHFARRAGSVQYDWVCADCEVRASGRWTFATLHQVDQEQLELLREGRGARTSSGHIRVKRPRSPAPILVVEDDVTLRDTLRAVLEDEDFPTVGAASGKEALDYLRTKTPVPCLILLDLMMPHMNGWEFYEVFSRDHALPRIPIVVMSAHDGSPAVGGGALKVLRKPLHLDDLLAVVESLALQEL
ncbi:MAG TPA: response regulator [Polyangiaceae bacterium]|nr:response regulator [Polyangiaceae bacterium]